MAVPHTQTSGAARLAVVYITVGSLIDVWTAVWFTWMKTHNDGTDADYFWCYGLFLTGLVLAVIGLALGRIGQSARPAEAPTDNTAAAAAAPRAPAAAPVAPQAVVAAPVAPQAVIPPANGQGPAPVAAAGGAIAPDTTGRH